MKQNNANMLFKSLALCFLILGNLTFEVLCAPGAPAAAVTVVEGEVDVPKTKACGAIKKHYKLASTEDFFQSLIVKSNLGTTEYKFSSKLTGDGKSILAAKINETKTATLAADAFKAFQKDVELTTKEVDELKKSADVNATDLETFMNDFKFEGGKFMLKAGNGSGVTLDIADNLVVYLKDDLPGLKTEVEGIPKTSVTIDKAVGEALSVAQVKLEEANKEKQIADTEKANVNSADATAVLSADAKVTAANDAVNVAVNELNDKKKEAIAKAVEQARVAVKAKVENAVVMPTGSTPAPKTLKELLDALNKYHIKIDYKYGTVNTSASTVDSTTVEYSIDTSSTTEPNISISAASIDNSKKFLPNFIDTKNVLAKDVFVAISEQCASSSAAVTDANVHFKAILTKLKSGFAKTVEDALSKTVTEDQFNAAFKPFATESDVDVAEADIRDKINLCWLSNVTDPVQQFNNYITWLESGTPAKLANVVVADKAAAIKEFFEVLQNNLAAYKTKLNDDLKPTVTPTGGNQQPQKSAGANSSAGSSNVQPKPKTGMSTTKKVVLFVIVPLSVVASGIIGIAGWYYYSKEKV